MQIIHDRVFPELARPSEIWNSHQGGLAFLPSYSTELLDYPSLYNHIGEFGTIIINYACQMTYSNWYFISVTFRH